MVDEGITDGAPCVSHLSLSRTHTVPQRAPVINHAGEKGSSEDLLLAKME